MSHPTQAIRSLEKRVELLAPAGHREALDSVLEAGADAVYLSTRRFNMRMHRRDYHFTLQQLADAVAKAHALGRRVYVTVNALLGEAELKDVRDLLPELSALNVDAVIVQDLAVLVLAREAAPGLTLHASTMMNVHHWEQAAVLKALGVQRIITSRDITLRQIGEIGARAGVEVECFVHGDMCVAQSGQCGMSGVLFGKSANRGQCMKPCRWAYELVRTDEGESLGVISEGHLLALKDLCLVRQLPEVIAAGICSLKLEGRMRDAAYLHELVEVYRRALDSYYAFPPGYGQQAEQAEEAYRHQVRSLSTLTLLDPTSHRDRFDTSGRREPLFLSDGCIEADLDEQVQMLAGAPVVASAGRRIDLAVSVGDEAAAQAALEAGADRIYFAAERSQYLAASWNMEAIEEFIDRAHRRKVSVGLHTPRITLDREWLDAAWLLKRLGERLDLVLIHHPGTLRLASRLCPRARLVADHGFNLLNSAAISLLADLGVSEAAVSREAGLEELRALAENSPLPLELFAHGPVAGMLVDHCVIALHASASGRKDVCRGPCRHVTFGLRDRAGQLRPVVADQYCRNHLLTGRDVATLPVLEKLLFERVASIRLAGEFDSAEHVAAMTQAYRLRLDQLHQGFLNGSGWHGLWGTLQRVSPRPLNLGAYPRSIIASRSTAAVMKGAVTA